MTAAIAKIRTIDNHGHPEKLLASGQEDTEWDGFPGDAYEATVGGNPPVQRRQTNPMLMGAWKALWQYPYNDRSPEHMKELIETKNRIKNEKGDTYPDWVLDQLGMDIMLANRVTMGRGLTSKRFRWVPYGDAYLFPLSTASLQSARPKFAGFYKGLEQRSHEVLTEAGKDKAPATLRAWLSEVVTPTLEKRKQAGAVALKFTAAYYRTLDFEPVSEADASAIYARFRAKGGPGLEDYRKLQDFIFYYVAREAGRLEIPVHLHCGTGPGAQYDMGGARPLLLDRAISELKSTVFVVVHGGWPYTQEAMELLIKGNVYVDFSVQDFLLTPRGLSQVLRTWMSYIPEKVMFGTDTFPAAPQSSWEEFGWLCTNTAREALALALTDMKDDGEISQDRAIELANMLLRENAVKLYKF